MSFVQDSVDIVGWDAKPDEGASKGEDCAGDNADKLKTTNKYESFQMWDKEKYKS